MRFPEEPRLPSLTSDATDYDKRLSIRLKELFFGLINKANQFETGSQSIKLGSNSDESKNFLISVPSVADGTLVIERGNGADVMRFGSDNSGQLSGFRNILINGDMRINQRNVTIAAAAIGAYGPDRWKKVDASNMTQIIEDGNYKYSSVYTLSGTGVTTQQITSPASGHWTIPSIPITATDIQLEPGSIKTSFEIRPIGLELALCQRYYEQSTVRLYGQDGSAGWLYGQWFGFKVQMRVVPTLGRESHFAANSNGLILDSQTVAGFRAYATRVGAGGAVEDFTFIASSEL